MNIKSTKIDSDFLAKIGKLTTDSSSPSDLSDISIDHITTPGYQIPVYPSNKIIQVIGTDVEALFFEADDDEVDVSIIIKNCPNLKYVQLSNEGAFHVSIVSDKSLQKTKGDQKIVTHVEDNPLPDMLFINGVMKELFVMWGGAKEMELRKDINNAVTRESKLLPEEYVSDADWEARGGIWKYDVFETFNVEPNIVYDQGGIDSAFIGTSLGKFDFDSIYVDAVIVSEAQTSRQNPAALRKSSRSPIKQEAIVPSTWNVEFKVMYIDQKYDLVNCTKIICDKKNDTLCVYNAEKLTEIVGNDKREAKIDVGNCPNLKEIKKCSIDYVGLNDMDLLSDVDTPKVICLDGHINKFYAENFAIDVIKSKSIQDYFIIGDKHPDSPIPDIVSFDFTENAAPKAKRIRSNPALVTSNVSGYQAAKEKIQSLLLNTSNGLDGFAIIPQSMDSIFYLVDHFYDEVYVKMAQGLQETPASYIDFMKPYIRGAGEAITPEESKYSILFLNVVLTKIFDLYVTSNGNIDDVPQAIIDMIWDARMKCLSVSLGKYTFSDEGFIIHDTTECDAWVWNFDRVSSSGSLDDNKSVTEYINAWLCDISLYIYASLLGSKSTKSSAKEWADKALPKSYAPIQLYAIQAITGSNEARGIFLYGLIKLAKINNRSDIIQAMNKNITNLKDKMLTAMQSLPFSYSDIKLSKSGTEFEFVLIEQISVDDVDLFEKTSSYNLMTKRSKNGNIGGGRYDYEFNTYMLFRFVDVIFLGQENHPKTRRSNTKNYWTSLFRDVDMRQEILDTFVYSYLMNLPISPNLVKLEGYIETWDEFGTIVEDKYKGDARADAMGLTQQDLELVKSTAASLANISDSSGPIQKTAYRASRKK